MKTICYYPILKWKKGEKKALNKLTKDTRHFIPVIELVEDCGPNDFFKELAEYYEGPIYFDTFRWDEDRTALQEFTAYAADHEIKAWPILNENDVFTILKKIYSLTKRFAVKIPIPDDFDGPASSDVVDEIRKHSKEYCIDLFFDGGEVLENKNATIIYSLYKDTFTKLAIKLEYFNNIVVCLTSFPESLSIESGEDVEYNRYDIKIFKKLIGDMEPTRLSSKLAYSDYGVTKFTESEIDFRFLRYGVLPKVKYTTFNKYMVYKGKKARSPGESDRSYINIASYIIKQEYFFGKDFSHGDENIFLKATDPRAKPGNATNWVEYSANHHLAVVMKQLSSLSEI